MRLRKPLLAQLLLLVALLGAFGTGSYYTPYVQDITGICALLLFTWLSLSTKMEKTGLAIVYLSASIVALLVILYAYVFHLRTGAPVLPSILSQRDFIFFLLAPAVYMLHVRGWRLADFGRVLVFAATVTLVDYVAESLTIDLESWYASGDFYRVSVVTYDEWRGYRLKGPIFAALFVVLYFGRRALRVKDPFSFAFQVALTILPVAILSLYAPRSGLISVAIALILYGLFLSRAKSAGLLLIMFSVVIIVIIFAVPYTVSIFQTTLSEDLSYIARVESAETARGYVSEHPLLGHGSPSYKSVSFQDLFGEHFYPSDIGLLGVAFQFGLVGLSLYLFFSLWVSINLLRTLWAYPSYAEPTGRDFLWALFIVCFSLLIASPLQAHFVFSAEGIAIGAFSWGLLLGHRQGLPTKLRGNFSINTGPTTATKPIAGYYRVGHERS